MIYIDTNIIMRYLLEDHPVLSLKAKELIDDENRIFISEAVAAEVVYVLFKVYKVEKQDIMNTLTGFFNKKNIYLENIEVIIKSLEFFAINNMDYIDCLLLAFNKVSNVEVKTFDIQLNKYLINDNI